jgi:hypothetical protein
MNKNINTGRDLGIGIRMEDVCKECDEIWNILSAIISKVSDK